MDEPTIPSAEDLRAHQDALAAMAASAGLEVKTPPIDYRTDPSGWMEALKPSDKDADYNPRLFDALSTLLAPYGEDKSAVQRDALPLLRLFQLAEQSVGYRVKDDPRFWFYSHYLLPTTPSAVGVLRMLRMIADHRIIGPLIVNNVEPDSSLGRFLAALGAATKAGLSPLLQKATNRTSKEPGEGYRIGLEFHARTMASMPRGKVLPQALLGKDLIGFEIENPLELVRECDMCADGVASFLDHFGLSFERESGIYECSECGYEHEDEDRGDIESIDPFSLTEPMLAYVEKEGYGESLREYIAEFDGGAESLSDLLEDEDATLARLAPDKNGIKYDSDVWRFEPHLEVVPGADELEVSDAIHLGALLARVVDAHTSESVLPPVPGTLYYRPMAYESQRIGDRGISFGWDPCTGYLTHMLGGRMQLRVNSRTGLADVGLRSDIGNVVEYTPHLEIQGGEHVVHANYRSGGKDAALLLNLVKGRASI